MLGPGDGCGVVGSQIAVTFPPGLTSFPNLSSPTVKLTTEPCPAHLTGLVFQGQLPQGREVLHDVQGKLGVTEGCAWLWFANVREEEDVEMGVSIRGEETWPPLA